MYSKFPKLWQRGVLQTWLMINAFRKYFPNIITTREWQQLVLSSVNYRVNSKCSPLSSFSFSPPFAHRISNWRFLWNPTCEKNSGTQSLLLWCLAESALPQWNPSKEWGWTGWATFWAKWFVHRKADHLFDCREISDEQRPWHSCRMHHRIWDGKTIPFDVGSIDFRLSELWRLIFLNIFFRDDADDVEKSMRKLCA